MKAAKRIIISIWTVEYELVESAKVKILNYSKADKEGYDREHELPHCELKQNEDGIVTHLLLKPFTSYGLWINEGNATEIYEVVNPKDILEYETNN